MPKAEPRVIEYRVKPDGHIEPHSILRTNISSVDSTTVQDHLGAVKPLPPPRADVEKVNDNHKKILSFVPERYRSALTYRTPSTAEVAEVAEVKKARKKKNLTNKAANSKKRQQSSQMQAARRNRKERKKRQMQRKSMRPLSDRMGAT